VEQAEPTIPETVKYHGVSMSASGNIEAATDTGRETPYGRQIQHANIVQVTVSLRVLDSEDRHLTQQ
jgi:hypothetical protein